tara:strand:- start:1285 stop:3201 length:1917 start_codon:yes stop_codon:yes gene_type:complete
MNLRELPDLSSAYKEVQDLDEKKVSEKKAKENREKRPRWWDDDGDRKGYEKGEVKKEEYGGHDVDWLDASVEVSTDYFFEEGINEEGLDMIIEEVGLEDFIEFVTDPIEELNEEARSARKASVRAPSYEKVKAAVDKSDAAKKASGKGEYSAAYKKKETDVTNYGDDKAPAKKTTVKAVVKKAPVKKKAAPAKKKETAAKVTKSVAKAKTKQPAKPATKKGIGDKIRGAIKKGVERHQAARAKGKVPEKRVKEFAKGVKSGVKTAVKFAKDVKKVVSEDVEYLDLTEWATTVIDTLSEDPTIDEISEEELEMLFEEALTEMTSDPEELMEMVEIIEKIQLDEIVGTLAGGVAKGAVLASKAARSSKVKKAVKGAAGKVKAGLKTAAKVVGKTAKVAGKAAKATASGAKKVAVKTAGAAGEVAGTAVGRYQAAKERAKSKAAANGSKSQSSSGGLSKSSGAEEKSKSKPTASSVVASASKGKKPAEKSGETRKAVGDAAKSVGKAGVKVAKKAGGLIKKVVKKAVGKTSRLVSKGSDKLAKRLGEDFDRIDTLVESGVFNLEEIENIVLGEKATPASGTGKYYKEGKPTAAQLAQRAKREKIKDLTNKGKHKEASALHNEGTALPAETNWKRFIRREDA